MHAAARCAWLHACMPFCLSSCMHSCVLTYLTYITVHYSAWQYVRSRQVTPYRATSRHVTSRRIKNASREATSSHIKPRHVACRATSHVALLLGTRSTPCSTAGSSPPSGSGRSSRAPRLRPRTRSRAPEATGGARRRDAYQKCTSDGRGRQGVVLKHRNFIREEPVPCHPTPLLVQLCAYLAR